MPPSIDRAHPPNAARRWTIAIGLLVALLASWAVLTTPASAQEEVVLYYVATDGEDVGDCTGPAEPCETINYAIEVGDCSFPDCPPISPSREVRVAAGTYEGNVDLAFNQNVAVIAEGDATITGGIDISNADRITVRGFNVQGRIDTYIASDIVVEEISSSGGVNNNSSAIVVRNSSFTFGSDVVVGLRSSSETEDRDGRPHYGGWTPSGPNFTLTNVTVTGAQTGISLLPGAVALIEGVTVTGAETAISIGGRFGFEGPGPGVDSTPPASAIVTGSRFEGSVAAMAIFEEPTFGHTIHSNQILGPVVLRSDFDDPVHIDLTKNWWGSAAGPGTDTFTYVGTHAGTIEVDASPWCADAACGAFLPVDPPPVDPPPVDPPPVDPPPVDPPGEGTGDLPKLPPYYSVPDVVGVTLYAGDEHEQLPALPKDEWLEEARRLLPYWRGQEWFPSVIVTVLPGSGDDPGELKIVVPEGVTLEEVGH